jgi:hypothetical protein
MTLLSTMSATAAGKSYPMSRSDSVSRAAEGVIAADLATDMSQPPQPVPHTYTKISQHTRCAPVLLGVSTPKTRSKGQGDAGRDQGSLSLPPRWQPKMADRGWAEDYRVLRLRLAG